MTKEDHLKRHQDLHNGLDELFADAIIHAGLRTHSTILELIQWSFKQTKAETIDHEQEPSRSSECDPARP